MTRFSRMSDEDVLKELENTISMLQNDIKWMRKGKFSQGNMAINCEAYGTTIIQISEEFRKRIKK